MKKRLLSFLCMALMPVGYIHVSANILQDSLYIPDTWQKQLEYAKNNYDKDAKGDVAQLRLLSYTYKGMIKSEVERKRILDSLLSADAPIVLNLPQIIEADTIITNKSREIRQKSFPQFGIITIRKMQELNKAIGREDLMAQMRKQLLNLVQIGFEYLELEWSYKGKKYHSLCVVSNEWGGIIYEPIGGFVLTGSTNIIMSERSFK